MSDSPPMVYVVDDDDAVRNSLRLLLKSSGMMVTALFALFVASAWLTTLSVTG